MSARQTILNQVMRFADPADMDVGNWDICTDNILSALDAAGYAVVPRMPTEKMLFQSWRSVKFDHNGFINVGVLRTLYAAMITAAKETP